MNERCPDISVIVPVYKAEPYLDFCVQSILNQSFKDFELVLIDDGSPDNCPTICDQWASLDPRIKVIHQRNSGISATRNVGVQQSSGNYIAFVDSDDFIEPDMLQDLLDIARNSDADIIIGQYVRDVEYLSEKPIKTAPAFYEGNDKLKLLFTFQYAERTAIISNWGKLYRRDLFQDICFPEGRVFEDESTVHQFLISAHRIAITSYPYYHYVWRPNSIITGRAINSCLDKQLALLERVKALQNTEFSGECSRYYYAYCVDFIIEMCEKHWIDTEKISCETFVECFLSNKDLFWAHIPWHQKTCVCLAATKSKAVLRWLARNSFAPGRNMFRSIKALLKY